MKKNTIVCLMILALVIGLLAGCSPSGSSGDIDDTKSETVDAVNNQDEALQTEIAQEESPLAEDEEIAEAPVVAEQETTVSPSGAETQITENKEGTTQTQDAVEPSPSAADDPAPVPEEPKGLADGIYSIAVGFSGGTGKARVDSPTTLYVEGGRYYALLTWSSPWYDYMIVGGTKYMPINSGGNSQFKIPVSALDTYMTVIGDTTAMSTPHEIEYTLFFDSTTIQ